MLPPLLPAAPTAWSMVYLVASHWLIDAQDGEIAWWHVVLMVFSQLRAFNGAILRGEPVLTGPGDAVANMAVIDACYAAAGLPRRESAPAWTSRLSQTL